MIGIRDFGWRLGNQMFQIAAAVGLATMYGDEVAFPQWDYAKYFKGDFTPKEMTPSVIYQQPAFHYAPIDYQPDMAIAGYFQSEKFFGNCKKKIKEIFSFKDDIAENAQSFNYNLCRDGEYRICAVHVRRGDYLKYPDHHPQQNVDYYKEAMKRMGDCIFLLFSDDIQWCKEQEVFGECVLFRGLDDWFSLAVMADCDDFIIGNSSYSWWGAWLGKNKNKTVIAPKNWFGPAYSHFNTKDLYCKDWIVL